MKTLCVVILNYRRGDLTIDCLRSLESEIPERDDRCVVVVDNASDDDSADRIAEAIKDNGWGSWAQLVRNPVNGGFAAGNNLGFKTVRARHYLLLNSDTHMLPGAIDKLLTIADKRPEAGLIGPRLQGPDGEAQISCFRYRSPISELLAAASTGPITWLFRRFVVAAPVSDVPIEPQWISFACVLLRRDVIEKIGYMDERYFMYFEDIDYSRRIRKAGWTVLHEPSARVVHLRGGSSSVKSALKNKKRVPRYYYESRTRYFAKFYGGALGLALTNALWLVGRVIALAREIVGRKQPHACLREGLDNWTNWLTPMKPPRLAKGGDL